MIKKLVIPLVFVLVGSSFVTYSFLDTFVIEKKYNVSYNATALPSSSFSFLEMEEEEEEQLQESSSLTPQESLSQMSSSEEHPISEPEQESKEESSSSKESSQQESQESSSSSVSSSESSSSSSSYAPSSYSDVNISTNQYYENLTKSQISALFTKEPVFIKGQHYSDSSIYVDITTDRFEDYSTYYCADIRIKSAAYLKTALARETAGENINEYTSDICKRHKGIIAIDGDTYGSQKSGYVIRNFQTIRTTKNTSRNKPEDLAIYPDGTFEIFNERDYTFDQIAAKNPYHVFSFGPGLIQDGEKIIKKGEEVGTAAGRYMNQRCAIGMIAPLHYIFVVSDGRIKSSPGLSLYQIGKIMEAKHAYCAYNLDGGGSATMYLSDGSGTDEGGSLINYCTQELVGSNANNLPEAPPIGEREVSDIVYIGKE